MLLEPNIDTPRGMIRRATRDIHERLHDHKLFSRLLAQSITQKEYCTLLKVLYGFHQPIEAALIAHSSEQAHLSMEGRSRAHLLMEDLNAICPDGGGASADLPLAVPPAHLLAQPGGFLGCLYVREGAMLGGHVMAGKLDHLLGRTTKGRRFFSGSPRDAGLWRSCCAAIDQNRGGVARDGMISAARETFELFERWITKADTNAGVGM